MTKSRKELTWPEGYCATAWCVYGTWWLGNCPKQLQSATTQLKVQLNNHMLYKPFSYSSIWPKCKLCVYKLKVEWLSQKNPRCNLLYQVDNTFIYLLSTQGSAISCPNERFSWNTSRKFKIILSRRQGKVQQTCKNTFLTCWTSLG